MQRLKNILSRIRQAVASWVSPISVEVQSIDIRIPEPAIITVDHRIAAAESN